MKARRCLLPVVAVNVSLVSAFAPNQPSFDYTRRLAHTQSSYPILLKATSDKAGDEKQPDVIQVENLAQEQIAELVEVTFINACMQLAQGFVDVLKLFIVTVKTSYERDTISVEQLVENVAHCPVNTAGRPLMPEEIELRRTWIHAVYLMLEYIGHSTAKGEISDPSGIDQDIRNTYSRILPKLVALKESGGTLKTQEFVKEHADSLPDLIYEDELQMAIVSQTIKVLWFTLVILEEERLANDNDDGSPITPKPQIPRGKGIN